MSQFLAWDDSKSLFLPLSQIAFNQFSELKTNIAALNLHFERHDEWTYIWGSNYFSSHRAYIQLQGSHPSSPLFKWMWKCKVQNKHKFFFWLFLRDRINTRNLQHRNNLETYSCVLCVENLEEDIQHIFFSCTFSDACWTYMGIQWDLSLAFQVMVLNARLSFNLVIFRERFIIVVGFCGATEMYVIIFDAASLSFDKWRRFSVKELKAVTIRAKPCKPVHIFFIYIYKNGGRGLPC